MWGIGQLYDHGGFNLVLWITAIVATVFVVNSLMISGLVSGVEGNLKRRQQPAE